MSTPQCVIVGAALLVAACGDRSATPEPADSAARHSSSAAIAPEGKRVGDTVVLLHDSSSFARAPMLSLEPTPSVRVGGGDVGASDLTGTTSFALLGDGRIAAFSTSQQRVLVFAADGRDAREIGRAGQAPGEFANANAIVALGGDTVFVADRGNARLNWILASRGDIVSEPAPSVFVHGDLQATGSIPAARVVLHSPHFLRRGQGDAVVRPLAAVVVTSRTGDASRKIVDVPDLEIVMREQRFRGRVSQGPATLAYGRAAHVAVWDTLIAVGDGAGYRIDAWTGAGVFAKRLLVERPRRAVDAELRADYIRRRLQAVASRGAGEGTRDIAEERRLVEEMRFADSLPPYAGFYGTADGTLWVVDPQATTDTTWTATAFRADGAIIGRLSAPGDATRRRPVAFGNDRVMVRVEDDDGIVALEVFRVNARGTQR